MAGGPAPDLPVRVRAPMELMTRGYRPMNSPTTMDPAPVLGLLPPDPHPVAGCGTCLRLARKRQAARAAGNGSGVSDCNVLIRAHPHGPRREDPSPA
jgi:hypothetical protein